MKIIKQIAGAAFVLGVSALATVQAQAAPILFTNKANFLSSMSGILMIEDFESVTTVNTALATLTRSTATYRGFAGVPFPNVFVSAAGFTNFGAGNNPTTSKILTANGDEDFTGTLATPATALGFDVYLNDAGPATVTFFNGTSVLGSIVFPASAPNFGFAGITDIGPITSFRFTSVGGGLIANTGVDNLFAAPLNDTGAVPEPATWATMLAGFAAMSAALRRKQHKTMRVRFA